MLSVMKAPTKKKQKAKEPELRNHIILVLDRSGSMASIWNTTGKVFDQTVKVIKDAAIAEKQATNLSLITFGSGDVRRDFTDLAIETVKSFAAYFVSPGGGTPLIEAVYEAAQRVLQHPDFSDPSVSFLVKVLTDGEATDQSFGAYRAVEAIQQATLSGRVTFVFEVPVGGREALHRYFNRQIPDENIQEWETTSKGAERAAVATTRGFTEYFRARSKGLTSTSKFYVDADKLTKTEIKRAGLKDITATQRVKTFVVGAETEIKPFIEGKTGDYQIGMAYYQLTKPEKLQARKLFLLKEKGKTPIYAGLDARALLGLPATGDVKITPGVLGKWDIFVQSTSVNRKLVRGSTVLYLG
jgi:uncharacterized protein YegL